MLIVLAFKFFRASWLPQWGAEFHLELDGLSFALILVAHLMALIAVWGSSKHIQDSKAYSMATCYGF